MPLLALSAVWSHINSGVVLEDAHNRLVDAKAHSDLLVHMVFMLFIERTESFSPIKTIVGANQISATKKDLEPIHTVHNPWEELTAGITLEWEPAGAYLYTGFQGAGNCGPTLAAKQALSATITLITLFFLILPLAFFEK